MDLYKRMFVLPGGQTYTIFGPGYTVGGPGKTLPACTGIMFSDRSSASQPLASATNVYVHFAGTDGWIPISLNGGVIYPFKLVGVYAEGVTLYGFS